MEWDFSEASFFQIEGDSNLFPTLGIFVSSQGLLAYFNSSYFLHLKVTFEISLLPLIVSEGLLSDSFPLRDISHWGTDLSSSTLGS